MSIYGNNRPTNPRPVSESDRTEPRQGTPWPTVKPETIALINACTTLAELAKLSDRHFFLSAYEERLCALAIEFPEQVSGGQRSTNLYRAHMSGEGADNMWTRAEAALPPIRRRSTDPYANVPDF